MDPAQPQARGLGWRLPRASGDGPSVDWACSVARVAAPRERGWTHHRDSSTGVQPGCPARAGMDPSRNGLRGSNYGLPRASGDGPTVGTASQCSPKAAPRERGWTHQGQRHGRPGVGCPARAGMDPEPSCSTRRPVRLPRASGDGPRMPCCSAQRLTAAPRERGWTPCFAQFQEAGFGCPARAGMDPTNPIISASTSWLPRASGDGPARQAGTLDLSAAAPRERGWTRLRRHRLHLGRGYPARVGMDPARGGRDGRGSGLPRASGDGPSRARGPAWLDGAAPRERGCTLRCLLGADQGRGCPARAGMDPLTTQA